MNLVSEWLQQAPILPPGGVPIYNAPPSSSSPPTKVVLKPGVPGHPVVLPSPTNSSMSAIVPIAGGIAGAGLALWLFAKVA